MSKLALSLLSILLCLSCKSSEKSGDQSSSLNTIGESDVYYDTIPNKSGDYILYLQQVNSASAERITFFVIDAKTKHKLVEKSIRPGYVKWIERDVIEFLDLPGTVATDEDLSAYIKKININESKR